MDAEWAVTSVVNLEEEMRKEGQTHFDSHRHFGHGKSKEAWASSNHLDILNPFILSFHSIGGDDENRIRIIKSVRCLAVRKRSTLTRLSNR